MGRYTGSKDKEIRVYRKVPPPHYALRAQGLDILTPKEAERYVEALKFTPTPRGILVDGGFRLETAEMIRRRRRLTMVKNRLKGLQKQEQKLVQAIAKLRREEGYLEAKLGMEL